MDYTLQQIRQGTGWPARARFRSTDQTLDADEVAAILARLADLWHDTEERAAVRSAVGDFQKAFQAKSPAFDGEAFWRACRIDLEEPAPCPAPGHLDPADPWTGVTVTADCGWCGELVRVR